MLELKNEDYTYMSKKPPKDKPWDWLPCIYDFKQEFDGKEIIWNFSPYVMLSGDNDLVSNLSQTVQLIYIIFLWHLRSFFAHLIVLGRRNRYEREHRNGQDVHQR